MCHNLKQTAECFNIIGNWRQIESCLGTQSGQMGKCCCFFLRPYKFNRSIFWFEHLTCFHDRRLKYARYEWLCNMWRDGANIIFLTHEGMPSKFRLVSFHEKLNNLLPVCKEEPWQCPWQSLVAILNLPFSPGCSNSRWQDGRGSHPSPSHQSSITSLTCSSGSLFSSQMWSLLIISRKWGRRSR